MLTPALAKWRGHLEEEQSYKIGGAWVSELMWKGTGPGTTRWTLPERFSKY
jgi:hypothetical protein